MAKRKRKRRPPVPLDVKPKMSLEEAKKDEELALQIADLANKIKGGNRRTKFAMLRIYGFSQQEAAEICGYHPGSGARLERQMRTDQRYMKEVAHVLDAIPDHYRSFAKARLPDVAEVEAKALEEMKQDPKLAIKHPGLIRSIKGSSGVTDEPPQQPQMVNIDKMQVLVQQTLQAANDAQDAEIVDKIEDKGGK